MNTGKLAIAISRKSPAISQFVGRNTHVLRRNAPHILFGTGVVGSVASTVLACRATLKLGDTLDEIHKDLDHARGTDHDVAVEYVKSVAKLGRLYGPSLAVGVVSIGCLSRAHFDQARRNTALLAAYTTLQSAYDNYRERVRADVGVERELDLYRGTVVVKNDDGDEELACLNDANARSPYARFFDEYSTSWEKDPTLNLTFVRCQQNYANDLLRARGHVFLNDVYDMLGLTRTPAGAVVGWLAGEDGPSDGYVDFGIYDNGNGGFVNGWERSVLLDFNVDGVIWNKI